MPPQRILIASDHAGVQFKSELQKSLPEYDWCDLGPHDTAQVDYPDFAGALTEKLLSGVAPRGVLICGSGIGMSIAANKRAGIRAALAENPSAAKLSREHNDANVLCLGCRFTAPEYGAEIVKVWLETPFSQAPRHTRRIEKIRSLEEGL